VRRAIIREMVASPSKPARSRGAAAWVSLLVIAACSSPNDFFERPIGTGGGPGGNAGGSGRAGGSAGSAGVNAGSGNAAGKGGNAGVGNSAGVGGSAGAIAGSGGSSEGQAGEGGESGDTGVGGTGGAGGSTGGVAGTQGEAGDGGTSGTAGDGATGGGGGMSGNAGSGGNGGFGGFGGFGGAVGGSGAGGKGSGGKGGCGSQPEVCDGVNNNCSGGADEGDACPSGCDGLTEGGRIYVLCSGSRYAGSWQDAEAHCEAAISVAAGTAMKLAVIETADENELLAEWVQRRNVLDGAWMGANDLDVDNEWAWGTGASRVPFYVDEGEGNNGYAVMNRYNDWGTGRPNGDSAMQDDEDCGHFDPIYNWRWNDRRCGDELLAFVCEQAP
jgi:hypothetical protein